MVKIMNYEFEMVNLKSAICDLKFERWPRALVFAIALALSFIIYNSPFTIVFAQQPQAPAGTPLYSVNAKYVNGMAPGYWATAGSGLVLNLSDGTAYCGNPPVPVSYPGGSLTLTASTTNYVYLDPAQNCAPVASTSAFAAGEVPIATVATGATSITSITDARTWFTPHPCATSSAGAVSCSAAGTNQDITLTPSGTGGSVIANLQDKGGQVFNVKAYGAKGDGATDDTAAFQAAYSAAVAAGGGTVLVPQTTSCYLLNSPINMTSISGTDEGVTIEGVSSKRGGVKVGAPGTICANTGGIVFDVTGSSGITFHNLDVTSQSGVTNPSLIGIYAARDSNGNGAQGIDVFNCHFKMVSHTSGTTYSFGAYLYGSETDHFSNDVFIADYPLVVTSNNDFGIHSAFITESSAGISEAGDTFRDMELDSQGLGPSAYFDGTWDMVLEGHIFNFSAGSGYASPLYNYAMEFIGRNTHMDVNVRQEGYPGWAYVALDLLNSTFQGTDAPAASPIAHCIEFANSATELLGDSFNINDELSGSTSNYYYDSTDSDNGVAVIDHVYFYCGSQTNCVDIPIGNYQPGGWALYEHGVTWSGQHNNQNPSILFNGPIYGSFSIPVTTVNANSCVNLSSVTSDVGLQSIVALSNTDWYTLTVGVVPGSREFTPSLCNGTSSNVTTGASGTEYWRVIQ